VEKWSYIENRLEKGRADQLNNVGSWEDKVKIPNQKLLYTYAVGVIFTRRFPVVCTGWPKKVSHYRQSSLNRIKNRKPG